MGVLKYTPTVEFTHAKLRKLRELYAIWDMVATKDLRLPSDIF